MLTIRKQCFEIWMDSFSWLEKEIKKRHYNRTYFLWETRVTFKNHDNVFSVNCTWSLPQMRFQPIKLLLFVCNVCSFIIFEFQGSSIGFQKEILKYLALFRRNTETTRTLGTYFLFTPKADAQKNSSVFQASEWFSIFLWQFRSVSPFC